MLKCAVHPGLILKDELDECGITPSEFAHQIDVPGNHVAQIIKGERAINGDIALRFGHWFGIDAWFWANLQTQFELATAEKESGSKIRKLPINPCMSGLIKDDPLISA